MVIGYVASFLVVAGALLYALAPDSKPKAIEAGRLMLAAGLFALAFGADHWGVMLPH